MKLIDFYSNILKSLKMGVDSEGFVTVSTSEDESKPVMVDGKPLVIPTREQYSNIMGEREDGSLAPMKILYNPMREDVIKGDSISLKRTKTIVEANLSVSTAIVVELLIKLASAKDLQKKASLNLNTFIASLKAADNANIKQIVDDGSVERWEKLFSKVMELPSTQGVIKIFTKRGGKAKGKKYARLSSLSFPLYDEICAAEKNGSVHGVKMRNKDLSVLSLIFEYIFTNIGSKEDYMLGSNDSIAPGLISLYQMYITIATRLNDLLEELSFIDDGTAKEGMIFLPMTIEEVSDVERFRVELEMIPSDLDVNRPIGSKLSISSAISRAANQGGIVKQPEVKAYVEPTAEDRINNILYNNGPKEGGEEKEGASTVLDILYGKGNTSARAPYPVTAAPQPHYQEPQYYQAPPMSYQEPYQYSEPQQRYAPPPPAPQYGAPHYGAPVQGNFGYDPRYDQRREDPYARRKPQSRPIGL